MGEMADYYEELNWSDIPEIGPPPEMRRSNDCFNYARYLGSRSLRKFEENLGPFIRLSNFEQDRDSIIATFQGNTEHLERSGIFLHDLTRFAKECGGSLVNFTNKKGSLTVKFRFKKDNTKKETKKMTDDMEFYYALLQSSGVKMVKTSGVFGSSIEDKSYTYLCAVDVNVGDTVAIQMRDGMGVATIKEVLDEWDMEIFESHPELKWVVNIVDVSNAQVYADQKKKVFEQLRQARLMEKAKKFAGAANLDFNSLVNQTQTSLGIEHQTLSEQIDADRE